MAVKIQVKVFWGVTL